MRYNVSSLLKAPVGARMALSLDLDHPNLGDDVVVSSIRGKLTLTRTDRRLLAQGRLDAVVEAECARCLETIPQLPIQVEFEELFLLHPVSGNKSMLVYGVTEDGYLDLRQPLREQILISTPTHAVCRPDCRGLCAQCGENLNLGDCGCSEEFVDPRLAALKSLLT